MSTTYPKFKTIEPGQPIYTIGIKDQSIVKLITKSVKEPTKPGTEALIVLTYYVVKQVDKMDAETLVAAALENKQVDIPTQRLITLKDESMVIAATVPPLVYATTSDELEAWMAKK